MIFDIQRVGPSTGLPTRTAQGDLLHDRGPLARRHQAHHADPGLGRGVLHDGDGGVRPRRALPDAGLRDERPRPRHEQLDVGRRSRIPRSRSTAASADAGDAGAHRRVGPLQGRRRRRHPVPHDSRRRHAGLLHARLRPQREGAVQRAAGRLRREHGPARAQVRDGARATCRSRSSTTCAGAKIGFIALRHVSTGRSTRAAISCARRRTSRRSYLRLRAYPFTEELDDVHRRARAHLRRRAEPRRADAAADEAGAHAERASRKLRSVLHYNGLPIDARSDHRRHPGAGRLRGREDDARRARSRRCSDGGE